MNFETSSAGPPPPLMENGHLLSPAELFEKLQTREEGLSPQEAEERLARYGINRLPRAEPPPWWQIALRQFQSPFVYILAVAGIVSLLIGEFIDAGFILGVLCLNASIGGFQEWRAERSAQALQKLLQIRAAVERNGQVLEIDAELVVPGDIVWLESGNRVPADIRLLSTHGLKIDESLLTGESLPVAKNEQWTGTAEVPVADRLNMAYAGTIVSHGRGRGVVVATGMNTEVGRLAKAMMGAGEGKPPLLVRMEHFSQVLAWVVMIAIGAVALVGVTFQGYGLIDMFLFGVALAVAVIPEGLPVALTIALAIGTTRMARRKVIIRRLAAVEGLGSCTLIASDKTGTLTCNQLTVKEIRLAEGRAYSVTGQGFNPEGEILREGRAAVDLAAEPGLERLLRCGVLCNEGDLNPVDGDWAPRGDPTDVALLALGMKGGLRRSAILRQHPQINEIPFEPEYRYAASFHKTPEGEPWVYVKGSPERVLDMCRLEGDGTGERHLKTAEALAAQGYRVLALAHGQAPGDVHPEHPPPEPAGLTFLGFVGMMDPLREGVREAIAQCREAGIEVAIITGDHPVTALAIARDLGMDLREDQVVTGKDLSRKTEEELKEIVKTARLFARVAPHQKLALVNAFRAAGHFVAVTGDGVNDAPALRAANIGVAMGQSGTDVAREAAELVISDDNFATIVGGIEEGRIAYDNIRKVIFMVVSQGGAEVVLTCLAVGLGFPLPLTPAQLLWLNLVTQGIQDVSMGFEPGEGDELKRKPRDPGEPIFNRLMIHRSVLISLWIGGLSFGLFLWMLDRGVELASVRNVLLLFIVLSMNLHMFNCRSETKSFYKIPLMQNPVLVFGVSGALLFHVLAMYTPWGQLVLKTGPVGPATWALVLVLASSVLVVMEWHKRWWNARHPQG